MAYNKKPDGIFRDPKTGKLIQKKGSSRRVFWSRQMIDDLRRMFPNTLNAEVAEYLGVSQRTMLRKARELGIRKDPKWLQRIWDERRKWAQMASRHLGNPGRFRKGVHYNPGGEFKKGHQLTAEQRERCNKGLRKWYKLHPAKAREKALKAWETRRSNNL